MTQRYPKGLFFLFVTEMWERFSFYGISAILVLYLTKQLGVSDEETALASGAYIAFTFMTPILGGFVADKVLGLRYSVTLGGVLILLGNMVLAWGGGLQQVFLGLTLVALGTGYLKATVSVMVGKLYSLEDTRRDAGYTLFYMGINLGALLAGILVAFVASKYGWTRGFYLSSAGMLLGLVVFQIGFPHYNNEADNFRRENLFKCPLGLPNVLWMVLGTVAVGAVMYYLFRHSEHTKTVVTWLSMAIIVGILVLGFLCKDKKERDSIFAILIIIVAAICFQSFLKQLYNSIPLFVDRDFDTRLLPNWEVPAASFALVPNSLAVIVFAGMFTWLWARLAEKGRNPSIPVKIVIALCFAIASSGMLAWLAHDIAASGQKATAWWIVLAIAVLTLGELHILPMGLSAVSALAPARFASLLMGSWFLCSSLGGYFSGLLTSLAKVDKDKVHDVADTAAAFYGLYGRCALGLVFVALIMLAITPFVKRLMSGTR